MTDGGEGEDEASIARRATRDAEAAARERRTAIRRSLNPWTWGLLLIALTLIFTWAVLL